MARKLEVPGIDQSGECELQTPWRNNDPMATTNSGLCLARWCLAGRPLSHTTNVQNPADIPLYWLVDRDPYNGLL